jgi:hypothetical protein
LDSLQPTGVSPASTRNDAPFLPQRARTCPLPLDEPDETGSGASEPPPDGLEGVPLELGETGALGDGEGSGVGVDVVPEGVLGVAGGVVASGVLGVAGGVVASGMVPDGALGVAGGVASGIVPDGGVVEGVPGGETGEELGEVGVASMGCA